MKRFALAAVLAMTVLGSVSLTSAQAQLFRRSYYYAPTYVAPVAPVAPVYSPVYTPAYTYSSAPTYSYYYTNPAYTYSMTPLGTSYYYYPGSYSYYVNPGYTTYYTPRTMWWR